MELRYVVSREDYLQVITFALRQKAKTPLRVLFLFLSTVGQMGAVGWFLLSNELSAFQRVLLGALSLSVAALNAVNALYPRLRARTVLSYMEPKLSADYWQPHLLTLSDEAFSLCYGEIEQRLPLGKVTRVVQSETLILIFSGQAIFEAIPSDRISPGQIQTLLHCQDPVPGPEA